MVFSGYGQLIGVHGGPLPIYVAAEGKRNHRSLRACGTQVVVFLFQGTLCHYSRHRISHGLDREAVPSERELDRCRHRLETDLRNFADNSEHDLDLVALSGDLQLILEESGLYFDESIEDAAVLDEIRNTFPYMAAFLAGMGEFRSDYTLNFGDYDYVYDWGRELAGRAFGNKTAGRCGS